MGRHEAPESATDRPEHEEKGKKKAIIHFFHLTHELWWGGLSIMLFDQMHIGESFVVLVHHVAS